MRAAMMFALILASVPLGACKKQDTQQNDQNVAIDINSVSPNDIEELPADESSATPSNELANGYDNADVNDAGNSY